MHKINSMQQITSILKHQRLGLGLKQVEVANAISLDYTIYSRIESQGTNCSVDRLIAILDALNLEMVIKPKD